MSEVFRMNTRFQERRHTLPSYKPKLGKGGSGLVWYPCVGACGNFIPGPLYLKWHRVCVPCQRRRGLTYAETKG